jgi:hypothetical protein
MIWSDLIQSSICCRRIEWEAAGVAPAPRDDYAALRLSIGGLENGLRSLRLRFNLELSDVRLPCLPVPDPSALKFCEGR